MELEEEEGVGRGGWDQNGAWKKRMGVGRGGRSGNRRKGLEGDGFRAGWVLICSSSASGSLCKCDAIEAEFLFGIKGRKSHLHLWQEQVFHWEGKCSGKIEIP